MSADDRFMAIAMDECRKSFEVGGIPVGAALVSSTGELLGQGRNLRVQEGSAIKHAETVAIENAALNHSSGSAPASVYRGATVYTTLIPCAMCTGAMLLYGITRVVYACRTNVLAKPDTIALLREHGVECVYKEVKESRELLERWIKENDEKYREEPWAT